MRTTGRLGGPELTWFEQGRETEEERRWREHGNQHLQLLSRAEFNRHVRHERRIERALIAAGAVFDLTVVLLALDRLL